MKNIYILLTRSSTILSTTINLLTKDEYTHVSIAFDENLESMCSFARKYANLPLPGGLMDEGLFKGYFKGHPRTPCMMMRLQVEDEAYELVKNRAEEMLANRDSYRFNIRGLFLCKFGIVKKRENYYFCSEFVTELLEMTNAVKFPKCSSLMHPQDYASLKELKICYKGTIGELAEFI